MTRERLYCRLLRKFATKRPAVKSNHISVHLITLSDKQSGKALKTGFLENKGQSGPLSVNSKTRGKCQLSVKCKAFCQLSVKILAIGQLSVNPIHTLMHQ